MANNSIPWELVILASQAECITFLSNVAAVIYTCSASSDNIEWGV